MYKVDKSDVTILRKAMRKNRNKVNAYRRMLAVRLRGEGKTNEQIARITDFNSDYIGKLCKTYCEQGVAGLINDGRKGGNHHNMDAAGAEKFLSQFEEKSKEGHIATVKEISEEYDKATGKEHKSRSSVYYFLHSHDWRKIVPRQQHPEKASEAEIEASKKLTLR